MPKKPSPLKCFSSRNDQFKTWIILTNNNALNLENTKNSAHIVKLRHPRTGLGALFLFSDDNSIVQEIFSFSEKRSWFINNSVKENGKVYFSTPLDPLFLILPYLKKSKEEGKVIPLNDLLIDENFPESYRLLECASKNVHLLAERKGPEDVNAWMYNEDKVLEWLCKKTEKVFQILKNKGTDVEGGACSKNFVKSAVKDDCNNLNRNLYMKYSHELVSEYLTDDLSKKLLVSLKLPEESCEEKLIKKRKHNQQTETELTKKVKLEDKASSSSKGSTVKMKTKMNIAHGSKTITSFFK